jgi:hypothetical protein
VPFIFYISLTVHRGIIIVNNQLDGLLNVFIYFPSLHVSSNPVLIIRRIEFCQYIIWYMSLCVGDCLVCRSGRKCVHTVEYSTVCTQLASRLFNITTATTGQKTIVSETQSDLLMMGVKTPETC